MLTTRISLHQDFSVDTVTIVYPNRIATLTLSQLQAKIDQLEAVYRELEKSYYTNAHKAPAHVVASIHRHSRRVSDELKTLLALQKRANALNNLARNNGYLAYQIS